MSDKKAKQVEIAEWRVEHDEHSDIYQAAERFAKEALGTDERLDELTVVEVFDPTGIPLEIEVKIKTNDRAYVKQYGIEGRGDPRNKKPGEGREQKPL